MVLRVWADGLHFETRSEFRGKFLAENKDYKRIFRNPRYQEELEASAVWDQGCIRRLANMVVALNVFLAAIRENVDSHYRLKMGGLAHLRRPGNPR